MLSEKDVKGSVEDSIERWQPFLGLSLSIRSAKMPSPVLRTVSYIVLDIRQSSDEEAVVVCPLCLDSRFAARCGLRAIIRSPTRFPWVASTG